MKIFIHIFAFIFFNSTGLSFVGQCEDIQLVDASFEGGTLHNAGTFIEGFWYTDDGCEVSPINPYEGDSIACSNGGGAFQLIAVEPNTTYHLSSFVLNESTDQSIAFNINWIHYPIDITSTSWEIASQSFNSGLDTLVVVGFYSDNSCFDNLQLTCLSVVDLINLDHESMPYL